MITRLTISLTAALAAAAPAGALGDGPRAQPAHDPADFVRTVDNPYFPLTPGSRYVYRGSENGHRLRDVFLVTHRHRRIAGVPTTVIRDRVYQDGRLNERTTDWYAQDRSGTVWYFGERTAVLDAKGHVRSREGTWLTGRHGARPGVFMPAHPRLGQAYQQEHYAGHAEDRFRIVSRHARVHVPAVSSRHALRTREWTPLEPGVRDAKLYVRGIGTVLERTVRGGDERLELVSFTR